MAEDKESGEAADFVQLTAYGRWPTAGVPGDSAPMYAKFNFVRLIQRLCFFPATCGAPSSTLRTRHCARLRSFARQKNLCALGASVGIVFPFRPVPSCSTNKKNGPPPGRVFTFFRPFSVKKISAPICPICGLARHIQIPTAGRRGVRGGGGELLVGGRLDGGGLEFRVGLGVMKVAVLEIGELLALLRPALQQRPN